MMEIAGKTAFVTGAASGIGLGIATALSQAGVKVMLCDIEDAALVKAVADLKLTNADVDGVRADVSLKAELQAAAEATIARYGKVHIRHPWTRGGTCVPRQPRPGHSVQDPRPGRGETAQSAILPGTARS